ncbi:glycosyltransferase family 4 protein [Neptuniibacter sp. QD29_5]|uniref:glycosyltransferase family 4 protein n=1 Tax=Neptuniibacter sp. QD29_5 TaxID=3398207 RepID=UPI0039F6139B
MYNEDIKNKESISVCFVDPQSYSNLEKYDCGVLSSLKPKAGRIKLDFYANEKLESNIDGAEIIKIFNYSDKKYLKLLSLFRSLFLLYFYIYKKKYDVVHFQWLKLPILEWFVLCCFKLLPGFNSKLVFTAHNLYPHNSGRLYKSIYRLIYCVFDVIVCHASATAKSIEKLTSNPKVMVIPHGIIYFDKNQSVNVQIKDFIQKNSNRYILSFGRMGYYKGTDLLVAAWAKSQLYRQGYSLVLAGAGASRFSGNTRGLVIYDSFLTETELHELSVHCLGQVLPYREISQSGVLLSIIAYKKPILLSNVGGFADFCEQFGLPLVIDKLTVDDVSTKLNEFVDFSSDIYESRLHEATVFFRWENISKKTLSLYENLAV